MVIESIDAIRSEKRHELLSFYIGEARANADVLEALTVVKTEQQRADRGFLTAFVPAETSHDAVALARVLHFQHHSLVWRIRAGFRLRNHAVESRAFEPAKPVFSGGPVARGRREVKR